MEDQPICPICFSELKNFNDELLICKQCDRVYTIERIDRLPRIPCTSFIYAGRMK